MFHVLYDMVRLRKYGRDQRGYERERYHQHVRFRFNNIGGLFGIINSVITNRFVIHYKVLIHRLDIVVVVIDLPPVPVLEEVGKQQPPGHEQQPEETAVNVHDTDQDKDSDNRIGVV